MRKALLVLMLAAAVAVIGCQKQESSAGGSETRAGKEGTTKVAEPATGAATTTGTAGAAGETTGAK